MKKITNKVVAIVITLAIILSMTVIASATGSAIVTWNSTLTMRFGDPDTSTYPLTHPEANMSFTTRSDGYDANYENGLDNYYPDTLAFYVSSGADQIDTITASGMTVVPSYRDGDVYKPTTNVKIGFYILHIETASSGDKYFTINTLNNGSVTIHFDVPIFTASTGSKICAYLPAPGQFTNEGVTTGGWGDAYDSTGALKNNTTTGVSLGAFGGYVVFDMGNIERNASGGYVSGGVENKSSTPYGTDFIIFGNAFWNNAEPGHIQVSQNGTTWFDIAGSKYYDSVTLKNQYVEYSIPATNHTEDLNYALADIESNHGTRVNISYSGSVSGTMQTNGFHDHCWFPFNTNYFIARTSTATELSKIDTYPFVSRTLADDLTSTLRFDGLRLSSVTTGSNNNAVYQFGYADVHPNKNLGGTVSYNPYIVLTSSSDWNTVANNTSGGDPIDISWAVNPDGSPAKLDAIRYIRVYTSAMQVSASFGEFSTEVCGVSICSGTASGSPGTPTITVAGTTRSTTNGSMTELEYMGSSEITVAVTGTGNVYINGAKRTNNQLGVTPSATGKIVQVIVQDGTAAPYITWLKLYSGSSD